VSDIERLNDASPDQAPSISPSFHDPHVTPNPTDPAAAVWPSLDRSLIRGVAWTAAAKWGGQLVAWASTFIVMRLLTPEDYGLVGMAMSYLGLLALLSEFGLGTAVLALRDLDAEQTAQIHGMAVLLGFTGFLASCIVAKPLGWFFHAPQLPLIVLALSTTFIVRSFASVPLTLLRRDLRFKRLAAFDSIQTIFLAIFSIGLALLGLRYWALVLVNIAGALISTSLVVWLHPQRFAWPRLSTIREAVGYSTTVIVERVAWFAFSESDFVVAGRMLGKSAVGVYQQAWNLAFTPIEKTGQLLMAVSPSIFSAVQDDRDALRRYMLRITEGMALITFPLSIGMALVAGDFVRTLLDERWLGMVVPLQILATYGMVRSLLPILSQLLVMTGEARVSAVNMVRAAIVMPLAFIVASRWGVVGIALAWVVVHPVVSYPLWRHVMRKIEMTSYRYLQEAIWPALSCVIVMALVVLGVGQVLSDAAPVVRLAAKIFAGLVTYPATLFLLHRQRLAGYISMLRLLRG
jgi:PST family polysaccharide transporter